jgi:hypothetical protein
MKMIPQRAPLASSKRFDHNPSDAELTCLLEGPSRYAGLKVVESDGILRVRATGLPVTGIMLSMVLGAAVITGGMLYLRSIEPGFDFEIAFWVMFVAFWLIVVFWWIVLIIINRCLAASDDFLRVDTMKRTLDLCRNGRTFRASEILAITEVFRWSRYDRRGGEWMSNLQTGVLVRADNTEMELHILVEGETRPPLTERLAEILHVPIRRVTLDKSESKALNDC